jgi:hypothetical protein
MSTREPHSHCYPACHSHNFPHNSELDLLQNYVMFRSLQYTWLHFAIFRNLSEYRKMTKLLNLRWIYIVEDTPDLRRYADILLHESVSL